MPALRDEQLERGVHDAIARRAELIARLHAEGTDCYRLFHGISEGRPGLTVDRYGPVMLAQTWREPLCAAELAAVQRTVTVALGRDLAAIARERGSREHASAACAVDPADARLVDPEGREFGRRYDVGPLHAGQDPLLFLDLRAARRRIIDAAVGRSVLNLFAYTCGVGVCAATAGATEVWNVDFAASALTVGRANAARNGIAPDRFRTIRADVIPTLRQLAALPVKGRARHRRAFTPFAPRTFDIVVLDPPRWSRGPFGAIDVVRDYPALFKPAVLVASAGGHVLATNHVPEVDLEVWLDVLRRCASKAGRPLATIEVIAPERDFPAFDGRAPLKIAWARVGD